MPTRSAKNLFDRAPIGVKVLLPLLLGASLLFVLTDVVYYGGKRESLAALAEGYLIRVAIRWAQEDAKDPGEVVVVSASDADYGLFPKADSALIRDVHIKAYARVLAKVAEARPRLVVVTWLSGAHPLNAAYLKPLTDTVDALGIGRRTLFALPFTLTGPIPQDLRRYEFRDADDCVYEVNSFCTYKKEWDWMIQALVDRLWRDPPPSHISANLPHSLPNFIANLPREGSLPTYSFRDILDGRAHLRPGAVIFIGNGMPQDLQFRENKYVIQRTYTAGSPRMRNLIQDGTPFHAFWAQVAQMFIDRTTVAVPTVPVSRTVTAVLCLFLLYVLLRLNLAVGFGLLVLYAVVLPLTNIVAVRSLKAYVPAFDTLYTGLIVFIAVAFIRLSINSFQRWRLEARQRNLEHSADLKANFISLISHNLNTPVAKLRGLLDMLLKGEGRPVCLEALRRASALVARLQLCIRAVLMATSLEVKSMAPLNTTVKALLDEFAAAAAITVQRLGFRVRTEPGADDGQEEILYEMLFIDPKVVALAMAAMAALVRETVADPLPLRLAMESDGTGEGRLAIRLTLPRRPDGASPFLLKSAEEGTQRGDPDVNGDAFFASSLANFLTLATKAHNGSLALRENDNEVEVVTYWAAATPPISATSAS